MKILGYVEHYRRVLPIIRAKKIIENIVLYSCLDRYVIYIVMAEWVDRELWSHAELELSSQKRRRNV